MKVGRRLARIGAVALKNSIDALPHGDAPREDFQWVRRENVADGGEATICEARFIDGLTDQQVAASFHKARDADYAQLPQEGRTLLLGSHKTEGGHGQSNNFHSRAEG